MRPEIDPRADIAFKRLFANEKETALAEALWGALVPGAVPRLRGLAFHNPLPEQAAERDKPMAFDSRAMDEAGRQLLLEMQRKMGRHLPKRFVYYSGVGYTKQLRPGEDYRTLAPVYLAAVLDGRLFPDERYYRTFVLKDTETGEPLTERPEWLMAFLELPKFTKGLAGLATDLDRWAWFLNHALELDTEAMPAELNRPEFHRAMEVLMHIRRSDQDLERYLQEQDWEREAAIAKMEAERGPQMDYEFGFREGSGEGYDVGLKSALVAQARRLQEILKDAVTPEPELAALALDDLSRRVEGLLTRIAARL